MFIDFIIHSLHFLLVCLIFPMTSVCLFIFVFVHLICSLIRLSVHFYFCLLTSGFVCIFIHRYFFFYLFIFLLLVIFVFYFFDLLSDYSFSDSSLFPFCNCLSYILTVRIFLLFDLSFTVQNICFIYLHSFIHPSWVYYELTICLTSSQLA